MIIHDYASMPIAFEVFLFAVYAWLGFCAILWILAMMGWLRCAIRERRRDREGATKVLPGSKLGPGDKFGTPAELTWTKSRGRVR